MKSSEDIDKRKEQADAEMLQIARDMKAYLKTCSKNELIRIVFDNVNLLIEARNTQNQLKNEIEELKNQLSQKETK